jgi:hypothetical protein
MMRLAPRKPVTPTTIQSIKTKALRRVKTQRIDPETNTYAKPSFLGRVWTSITAPFTRHWWSDRFEKVEGEVLVDTNLLVSTLPPSVWTALMHVSLESLTRTSRLVSLRCSAP